MIRVRSETAIHAFKSSLLFFSLYILLNFVLLQLLPICVLLIKPKNWQLRQNTNEREDSVRKKIKPMENKVRIALSSLLLLAAVLIKGGSEVFVSNNSLDRSPELPSIKCV